ncbi:MAG: spore coat protein CotJB [Clostridiales bacterium]
MDNNKSATPMDQEEMMRELQELCFATIDLNQYLDTHIDDTAAMTTFQEICRQKQQAYDNYIKKFGPLKPCDPIDNKEWLWASQNFPWD